MPDRNATPKLTKSAATATTTIVHIRPASTSPPASAGSRVRASSTIAMKGMTPLIAPITLKAMIASKAAAHRGEERLLRRRAAVSFHIHRDSLAP